jgi:hypothetical protein
MARKPKVRVDGEHIGLPSPDPFRYARVPLSISEGGGQRYVTCLLESFYRLVENISVQPTCFHDLRHTYAALMSRDDT